MTSLFHPPHTSGGGSGGITTSADGSLAITGTDGVVSAAIQSGAALGATAIQPSAAGVLSKLTITQAVATSGSPNAEVITGAAHTTLAASTEASDVNWNLARTVQFATGALTTQRAARIQAPTYGFVGASTLTNAATLSISGAPVAGTNATITNAWALWLETGALAMGASPSPSGDVRLSHGLAVKGNSNAGGTARTVIDWGASTADVVTVGDQAVGLTLQASSAANFTVKIGATTSMSMSATNWTFQGSLTGCLFSSSISGNCTYGIASTSTTTIRTLTLQGHSSSSTANVTAGAVTIAGGDATGASGTRNGGDLSLRAGTGATADGTLKLLDNATVRLSINGTGLGFFTAAPVAQPADVGAPAFTLVADAQTWCASLRTTVIRALGLSA